MTSIQLETLVTALQAAAKEDGGVGFKHNAPGTPATTGYVHGPGGWLTYPGVDPQIHSTVVGTLPSLLSRIPAVGSLFNSPVFEVITGIRAGTGSEPTEVCGPAPVGGVMKGGKITAPFGLYKRQTRELNLARMGLRNDRADPMDLQIAGNPIGNTPWTSLGFNQGNILTNEFDMALYERAVEFHRLLSRQVWQGNAATRTLTANGLAYAQMNGIEKLINTGYRDAETGTALPSLDPQIYPFAKSRLDIGTAGANLVNMITVMVRNAKDLAIRTGVDPVRWVLAMRPGLFYEITKVWPCAYFTTQCNITNGTGGAFSQVISVADQTALRDNMRSGSYLLVEGEQIPVIVDDGITEYNSSNASGIIRGCFSSDIFLLPMSVLGGRSTLYLEYFEYSNASIAAALGTGLLLGRPLANGAFFETPVQIRDCFSFQAEIQPRIILRTPWLAGRITDIQYCTTQPRQPFPDDPYFVNGGESTRQGPSLYSSLA